MKTFALILVTVLIAAACQSQPASSPRPPGASLSTAPVKEPVNYLIRVEWKEPKSETKFLEVLTAEGHFELDTIQKNSVKINNNDIPVTLRFNGTLSAINDEKGRLQLFLGRTVPYVTSTSANGASSSYSQLSVGLDSNFVVKFGKQLVVQNDETGEISVLVKRIED